MGLSILLLSEVVGKATLGNSRLLAGENLLFGKPCSIGCGRIPFECKYRRGTTAATKIQGFEADLAQIRQKVLGYSV